MEPGIIIRDLLPAVDIFEIQSAIGTIEKDASLYEEKNFDKRIDAIDFIGFHVIDQIEELLQKTDQTDQLMLLKYRAERVKSDLEEIDTTLFRKLRANIRAGDYTGKGFKNLVSEYAGFNLDDNEHLGEPDYDNLDILINGLTSFPSMPEQSKELEPEMVYYQKTPARVIFELAEKVQFTNEDVFFDLGSGLGQAAILVNLLTGITAKGVEFDQAFCDYARDCAKELNLSNVTFLNTDAREADYSEGTVFFMFTPFKGEIMQDVLEILRKESLFRKIKIITYGPCTMQVALQSWLRSSVPETDQVYKLCFFSSL